MYRMTAVTALAATLLALAACGGGSESPAANGSAQSTATGAGASPSAGAQARFTADDLARLAQTTIPGYTAGRQTPSATSLLAVYESATVANGARVTAVVTISPCDPFICINLDAANFKGKEPQLKTVLPEIHINNPALVFTIGNVELAPGYRGFFTYARSFVSNNGSTATANRYSVQYHDGTNQVAILLTAKSEGPFPGSEAEMQRQLDQPSGESAARTVFAAFQPAFRPTR
ncbi:MAG: hypothetical protein U0547_04520 [Dehalococcoidia bacterium]